MAEGEVQGTKAVTAERCPAHRPAQLPASFFARPADLVARELLGKTLVTTVGGMLTSGRIVETEAYFGADDPGSHAATRAMTDRNRVMYGPPGRVYVYFVYGNHHMLNLVTGPEGAAGAVLVRGVQPLTGIEIMRLRRGGRAPLTPARGPGCVACAFGIDLTLNDVELGSTIAVCDAPPVDDSAVMNTGRVGLSRGQELRLRFAVRGCVHVSSCRGSAGAHPRPSKERGQA